ncbi:hypothetical protein GLOIN_2v1873541 [Rhizophagus irregularis DAOM 181602=DAOM 197198]|nr:hypothetical protein GLOIN_2v1873541 [Rhizophagus irregularis DAOM 181602=DAOM 197198]
MSLSSAWRSVVRIVKKVQDKAYNYPKLPVFPLVKEHLPFQIGWNVSKKDYNTFFERNESTKLKFYLENRNVFIVAMPLPVHAAVVSMLQDFFKIPNGRVIRDPPITVLGAPSHYDPSDNTYTLKTYADVTKNYHGRIFCEVAYTEDLNFLHKKCTNWMLEGYVRYVLGIKIYEKRKGSINQTLTARLYSRVAAPPTGPAATAVTTLSGVFYQEWDFGTVQFGNNLPTGCNALNIIAYQVTIPVSEIFWDPPIGVSIGGYVEQSQAQLQLPPQILLSIYMISNK